MVDDDPQTLRYVRGPWPMSPFEVGTADYVVKPFSPGKPAPWIGPALWQKEVAEPLEPYVLDDLVIDYPRDV